MTTILVTGGAGFIGSNFIPYFAGLHPEYHIVNLDKLTYAGSLENLSDCSGRRNHEFVQGDICDAVLVNQLMAEHDVRGVVHFAAESHVDNSIANPRNFVETNTLGTFTLLDAARRHWMLGPHQIRPGYESARFHHVSTDEVFGTLGETGQFRETTPYAPNSPYSASKAGADFLARAFFRTYGMNVTISNCSNNYGPKQHREKLIPTIIRKALAGESIPIYGDGLNIRDWIHVLDHTRAIDVIFHRGRAGESYAIGGRTEKTNLAMLTCVCGTLDRLHPRSDGRKYAEQLSFVNDRPGHDRRNSIDISKIHTELGWNPTEPFDTGIEQTVRWYLAHLSRLLP